MPMTGAIMTRMTPAGSLVSLLGGMRRDVWRWWLGWWTIIFVGAQLLVLALTPASYNRDARHAVLQQVHAATAPGLLSFTALMALFNVVVIRIVVVTAHSYGLSPYALDTVVRVLVLELIPLTAALFVAVQYSVPGGTVLYRLRRGGAFEALRRRGRHPLGDAVLPRVLGGVFAVLFLSLVSCFISLLLAYVTVYGFSHWGWAAYTRVVGNIFNPAVSLIFSLKTLLFALIVALLPLGSAMQDWPDDARTSVELQGLVRMFMLLLAVEILSLVGNYY